MKVYYKLKVQIFFSTQTPVVPAFPHSAGIVFDVSVVYQKTKQL